MVTPHRINALREGQVLECLGHDAGDSFRVLIAHTSPSHYEAVGRITLPSAAVSYPASGPMPADLLAGWLETLFTRWPQARAFPWAEHPLDDPARRLLRRAHEAARDI